MSAAYCGGFAVATPDQKASTAAASSSAARPAFSAAAIACRPKRSSEMRGRSWLSSW